MTSNPQTPLGRPPLKPIHIGPVTIDEPVLLAPMNRVTDKPFRVLARRYGSGPKETQMIAREAGTRITPHAIKNAECERTEHPVSMQKVCSEPGLNVQATNTQEC